MASKIPPSERMKADPEILQFIDRPKGNTRPSRQFRDGKANLDNGFLWSYTYGLISLVIKGCGHLDLPHKINQKNTGKPLPVPYLKALIDS